MHEEFGNLPVDSYLFDGFNLKIYFDLKHFLITMEKLLTACLFIITLRSFLKFVFRTADVENHQDLNLLFFT